MAVAITSATDAEFTAFLGTYSFNVPPADISKLLALSYAFLRTIPFCEDTDATDTAFIAAIVEAQGFIAYEMSNGFNPVARTDGRDLKRKNIGRTAIEKEWFDKDDSLKGTGPMALLKSMPLAYGLLEAYICEHQLTSIGDYSGGVYVV